MQRGKELLDHLTFILPSYYPLRYRRAFQTCQGKATNNLAREAEK